MTTTYKNGTTTQNGAVEQTGELVRELYGGELYEYYPLGKYIVRAPGVCGGRPTFKYTRLEPSMLLALLAQGDTVEEVLADYNRSKISAEAIYEAIYLANHAFMKLHHIPLPQPKELEVA
ncbi:MAG: DUF433 domain-containing protein [Caldilineaceae bacterium]